MSRVFDRDLQSKTSQHIYEHDLLGQDLETLNVEHKQKVDDISDRIVDWEKLLASLQITADSKHTDSQNKYEYNEVRQLQGQIR